MAFFKKKLPKTQWALSLGQKRFKKNIKMLKNKNFFCNKKNISKHFHLFFALF